MTVKAKSVKLGPFGREEAEKKAGKNLMTKNLGCVFPAFLLYFTTKKQTI
jgi:hypothetical protein